MAEGFWNRLGQGTWQAVSAGSKPAGYVHPLAIRAMREVGIDLSHNESKSLAPLLGEAFDLMITVCDHAREACPTFPGAMETLHWPFDDPADAAGTEAEQWAEFCRVRDEIRTRIAEYLQG
jgi:arsenate reductase